MINKYRSFFPDIGNIVPAPLFGHKVWEQQIKELDNGYTISYDSFRNHKLYLDSETRDSKIRNLKYIEPNYDIQKEEKKINFNSIEKIYFFIRRKIESRKKNRKNY